MHTLRILRCGSVRCGLVSPYGGARFSFLSHQTVRFGADYNRKNPTARSSMHRKKSGLAPCAGPVGTKLCRMRVSSWSSVAFWPPGVFVKNATRTRSGAAWLPLPTSSPLKAWGLGLALGLGLRSGWSGPTCKVGNDHTRSAQSFVPTSLAHNGSRKSAVFHGVPKACTVATL